MKSELWFDHNNEDEFTKEDLTEKGISNCQSELRIILPREYISLLFNRNGFTLKKNSFLLEERSVELDGILGIGKDPGLLDNKYLIEEWNLPESLIIISLVPPVFICLDYRNIKTGGAPKVIFMDIDSHEEFLIANSFSDFINGLSEEKDLQTTVEPNNIQVVRKLSDYKEEIDTKIEKGTPKQINKLYLEIAQFADKETFKLIVEKMRFHKKSKVKFDLLCYLYFCATGENPNFKEDKAYLFEVLKGLSVDKNKDVKSLAEASLIELEKSM
ncbi:MAG: SMI1/KNR4 family protein [Bacillota bacterium]